MTASVVNNVHESNAAASLVLIFFHRNDICIQPHLAGSGPSYSITAKAPPFTETTCV
jgi:hypothetical protein